ncbi:MAG TPA: hypothetical protein VMB80_12550 [Candidatus Acidoferrum sp.]|nr:hypothetical protein [Candidatus Acidoferrum sp.]
MKTPREILLDRHRAAEPKLEAIRREVVAAEFHGPGRVSSVSPSESLKTPETGKMPVLLLIWREVIWPCRRIWTGLAAVWLLILAVNLSMRDPVSNITGKPVRSGAVMISWQTQQRWMSELLTERPMPPEADRPRNVVPGPRTESSAPTAV